MPHLAQVTLGTLGPREAPLPLVPRVSPRSRGPRGSLAPLLSLGLQGAQASAWLGGEGSVLILK